MSESSGMVLSSLSDAQLAGMPLRREMSIQDFVVVVSRRRRIVLGAVLLALVLGIVYCALSRRMYKATAEVQVQKDSADALSLDNMIVRPGQDQDSVEANMTLQTQAKILQSSALALGVINTLQLEKTDDFQPHFSLISWTLQHLLWWQKPPVLDAATAQAGRENHAAAIFKSHLKVQPIAGTRLISVEYSSSSPGIASAVVNQLVHDLIEFNFETRHGATQRAAGWLSGQLAELRKHSQDLQSQVVDLQRGSEVFTMGQTDSQGREQTYAPVLESLRMTTTQLSDAQSARIVKGALYEIVKNGDPESISGLVGNGTLSSASPGISGSLTLLQSLRGQEAQTQAQLNELSNKFGPGYPKLLEVQASLKTTQNSIAQEARRVADRVKNDFLVAQQVENKDRVLYEQQKSQAEVLNNKAVEYEIVRQEAAQSRNLYENLLSRLNEADLVAGLHSSNITMVDAARTPSKPAKPNVPFYIAGSLAAGLFLGLCTALLRDATDYSIQDIEPLGALGREVPIGVLPHHSAVSGKKRLRNIRSTAVAYSLAAPDQTSWVGREDSMIAAAEPNSPYTEALRALRTALMQGAQANKPPQVILVTSSIPGEGKSLLSINLATVFAQYGKRVLLVDTDLRNSALMHRLHLPEARGLSDLLAQPENDSASLDPVHLRLDDRHGFDVISAGPAPAFPADLLASQRMAATIEAWRSQYDVVLLDSAPMLPVTDSALIGPHADYILVVARHMKTDRRSLERTYQILESQGAPKVGIVLNGVRITGDARYQYYGYKPAAKGRTHAA